MKDIKIFGFRFYHLVCYFFVYSLIGWCIETVYIYATEGKFINRGMLNGPFCPIYGVGAVLVLIFLQPFKDNPVLFFLGSVAITSILEYTTAILLKILFNSIQWDYSNQPFNLNGRICLQFSVAWGVFAVMFVNLVHPHIHKAIERVPVNCLMLISTLMVLFFIIDAALIFLYDGPIKLKINLPSIMHLEITAAIVNAIKLL